MEKKIKILILEDSPGDARFIELVLEKAGIASDSLVVETKGAFSRALEDFQPDIILADYRLPAFDGLMALRMVQERMMATPFILVSGMIGEERAAEFFRAGAADYVLKDRLDTRLAPSVIRALRESAEQARRKKAEIALQRANRALKALSECNQALVRAADEQALLDDICRNIVQTGGYLWTWVGYVNPDKNGVRPVAWAGEGDRYLKDVEITWDDENPCGCPVVTAIRTGEPAIARHVAVAPCPAPPSLDEVKKGTSSLALPLREDERLIGVINIYATDPRAFDQAEMELLSELANDLSYGISSLRTRIQRRRAEAALEKSEELFRSVALSAMDAIITVDEEERVVMWNHAASELFGYTEAEIAGQPLKLILPDSLPEMFEAARKDSAAGVTGQTSWPMELSGHSRDGRDFPVELSLGLFNAAEGPFFSAIVRDVSERKRAEDELRQSMDKLRRITGGIVQTVALTVESRDPYTAGHQRRATDLARSIAVEMGLDQETIDCIRMAGAIHDLGKIHIPSEILSKPGPLSEIEKALIQTHSEIGYGILKEVELPWPIAQIILQHHERLDGSGYPRGLLEEEILMEARILSVADVVEAMSSHRPYRPTIGLESALSEIERNRGILYDDEVVDACLRLFIEKKYEFIHHDGEPDIVDRLQNVDN